MSMIISESVIEDILDVNHFDELCFQLIYEECFASAAIVSYYFYLLDNVKLYLMRNIKIY